jgi:hypothetical protein
MIPSILIISDKYLALVDRLQIRKSHFINRFYLIDLFSASSYAEEYISRALALVSRVPHVKRGLIERDVEYLDITIEAFEQYTTPV